jgi:hypothetical protein
MQQTQAPSCNSDAKGVNGEGGREGPAGRQGGFIGCVVCVQGDIQACLNTEGSLLGRGKAEGRRKEGQRGGLRGRERRRGRGKKVTAEAGQLSISGPSQHSPEGQILCLIKP